MLPLPLGFKTDPPQLATQFYASLKYISTHHPLSPPSALARAVVDPSSLPNPTTTATPGSPPAQTTTAEVPPASPNHKPIDPTEFEQDQRELAVDLVQKQKEIEALIRRLPRDLEGAEERQEQRIRELEREIRDVEEEVKVVGERREEVLERVEGVIARYKRV
jgi:mediator of RNA polymerase II transcription subunit 21